MMKQSNPGKPNISVKKPSAKGEVLRSAKENTQSAMLGVVKGLRAWMLVKLNGIVFGRFKDLNHKTSNLTSRYAQKPYTTFGRGAFKLAGLFVLFGILGFTVWQALLPQSARSKTFTFFQTARSSAAVLVVVLTAYFGHAIIKLINPPRAYFCRCGVLFCSKWNYD